MELLTFEQFKKIDIRVGTVVEACIHPTTKKPALQLKIDLGELGIKNSSAQITALYKPENLIKKQVLCVVNFAPMRIGGFISEVLTMGFIQQDGSCVLAIPEQKVPNGIQLS